MAKQEKAVEARPYISEFDTSHVYRIDGGWPLPYFRIPYTILKDIIKDCPRIVIEGGNVAGKKSLESTIILRKIIAGGIRMPHLHVKDDIVLLNKTALKSYLEAAANQVENIEDITDVGDFVKR